jgi:2-C-methyl-D-erythritol 4-phosphate cytidylyltransferase
MIKRSAAVIVAAGQGTRLGYGLPKAFVSLGGDPMFLHSVRVFRQHPSICGVVLVVPEARVAETASLMGERSPVESPLTVVAGGSERWQSARNGVAATPEDAEWVCIHDAARPFVTPEVIDSLFSCAPKYLASFTATPVVDTIREVAGDAAGKTIDRSRLLRVGTPQLFHKSTLMSAFAGAEDMTPPPTDEIMLMEQAGLRAGVAWGDPLNFKITTEEDLFLAEAIIEKRQGKS